MVKSGSELPTGSPEDAQSVEKFHTSKEWYAGSVRYWEQQAKTVNGMLGGYECVSGCDISASTDFLRKLRSLSPRKGGPPYFARALDCGAGIGRVTKNCLTKIFNEVDLLEPVEDLLNTAKELVESDKVKRYYCEGLQDFTPEKGRYDCIWIQWCSLYVRDCDLVAFLRRCKENVASNGIVCLKENVMLEGGVSDSEVDWSDNSITRTDSHYRKIFSEANLNVVLEMRQPKFPEVLHPVIMYGLR